LHAAAFTPPRSTFDAVLQSFINYPGTRWGNPARVLHALSEQYPGKPLFIETSTAGPPRAKAAWTERLGRAVASSRRVYALLYHEGAPGLHATASEARRWSVASDPLSLATMRHVVATVTSTERRHGH
jgi:hypothetical protein